MKHNKVKLAAKARNFMQAHPLLRKGGVHQKSNKAIRQKEKQEINKNLPSV